MSSPPGLLWLTSTAYGHSLKLEPVSSDGYVRVLDRYSDPVKVVELKKHCVAVFSLVIGVVGNTDFDIVNEKLYRAAEEFPDGET